MYLIYTIIKTKVMKKIDEDILDIKAWFGSWEEFKKRIEELEDDEKEAAWERWELDKLK